MTDGTCSECRKPAMSLHYVEGTFSCKHCVGYVQPRGCVAFEYGVENPMDKKGSTAHVRDIKARRIDPKTKTLFYYEHPKTYFFSK